MTSPDSTTIGKSVNLPTAISIPWRQRYDSCLAEALCLVYRLRFKRLRKGVLWAAKRLEGGDFHSITLRRILRRFHGVDVGAYSYGPILKPGTLPRGSRFGAYCSVASGLVVRRRDHPVDRLTQHPFFYNHSLGYVAEDTIQGDDDNPLLVGHDVWIGDRVTILSGCRRIGNGAVIAAGAVVSRDVAPYTIVGGVPARPIRKRFDEESILRIERSKWWKLPVDTLARHMPSLTRSLTHETFDILPGPRDASDGGRQDIL